MFYGEVNTFCRVVVSLALYLNDLNMSKGRKMLYSDSDIPSHGVRLHRLGSIGDYVTNRRDSLSDIVFSGQNTLSRDSVFFGSQQTTRISRHLSLEHSNFAGILRDSRSNSLVPGNCFADKKLFRKTRSSKDLVQFACTPSTNTRNSKDLVKTPLLLKRRRSMRRIQSMKVFESLLKKKRKPFEPLVRFRRAVKTVQLLLKATGGARKGQNHNSQQNQKQSKDNLSWSQFYDEHSTARRTYDLFGISFDPTIFKANRETSLSHEAKVILSLDPLVRSEEQMRITLLALNQAVDSFGEFPIKLQRSLASVGWYERFEAKRVIIRQGHMADNFYFIISGTAIVTILENSKDSSEQYVRTVAFLRKGNSFGELALMHGARRSATVTCKTDVELLAVSREDFVDIFMHIEKDREPEHIQFLRTVDILRGWPIEKLPYDNPRICLFTFFRRGVLLCKDSNTTEWIYIIKTGSCRVLKDLVETKPNIPGLEFIDYSTFTSSIKLPPLKPKPAEPPQLHRRRKSSYLHTAGNRTLYRRLPQLKGVTEENLLASASEHLNEINQIFTKRHRSAALSKSEDELSPEDKKETGKVFVQIQKLGPRDTFGLEQTTFSMMGQTTGCSLVSDGAECILINKKFFLHHLTDDMAKKIRKTIQPIPTEASLQQKLQDKTNWDAFKTMTITKFMLYKKDLHDYASLYY